MPVTRIQDDPASVTAVFENHPMLDEKASKIAGIPKYNDLAVVRITLAANKHTQGVFPANEIWRYEDVTENGYVQRVPITYAMRFPKQYGQFVNGDKQSFSGTLISELPFLTQSKRLELKGLNVHTAEALAELDGPQLKMLGPQGRELKNQAIAYLQNAKANAGSVELADALSIRDAQIEELKRQIDSLKPQPDINVSHEASQSTIDGFKEFSDDDLKEWLKDSSVAVDNRWSRSTLLAKANEILEKSGRNKLAA